MYIYTFVRVCVLTVEFNHNHKSYGESRDPIHSCCAHLVQTAQNEVETEGLLYCVPSTGLEVMLLKEREKSDVSKVEITHTQKNSLI